MPKVLSGGRVLLEIHAKAVMAKEASILSLLTFAGRQKQAATRRSPAIVVTAGAGSGKTRALVGRYLRLLEKGYPLRSLVAITFTDKAAREMRARIRTTIEDWLLPLGQLHFKKVGQMWNNWIIQQY